MALEAYTARWTLFLIKACAAYLHSAFFCNASGTSIMVEKPRGSLTIYESEKPDT